MAFFLVSEKNAVNQGVGSQGGFDRFGEGFLAAAVDAVGQDNQGFAALLLFHQFIGSEIDGVVEKRAAAMAVATGAVAAAVSTAAAAAVGTGLRKLRGADLIDGGEKFLAGSGEVLEEFYFVVEVDEEGFVFIFAEDAIEEGSAGGALLIENAALAEAGVDEEAEGEREIGVLCEIGDGLGLGVLFEGEVVFGEIADEVAVLVADSGEEVDGGDGYGDGGLLAGERESGQDEGEESCRKFPHFRSGCLSGRVGCQCLFLGGEGKVPGRRGAERSTQSALRTQSSQKRGRQEDGAT